MLKEPDRYRLITPTDLLTAIPPDYGPQGWREWLSLVTRRERVGGVTRRQGPGPPGHPARSASVAALPRHAEVPSAHPTVSRHPTPGRLSTANSLLRFPAAPWRCSSRHVGDCAAGDLSEFNSGPHPDRQRAHTVIDRPLPLCVPSETSSPKTSLYTGLNCQVVRSKSYVVLRDPGVGIRDRCGQKRRHR